MPKIRTYTAALATVLAGLAFCAGCLQSGAPSVKIPGLTKQASPEPDAAHANQDELPPKENARACLLAAERLQDSGHTDQAIQLYEKARRNDPGLKTIAHHLGVLYDLQGDSARSLSEYKQAVAAEPKNPDVFSDLGYYYYKRGNVGDAERELRKALEIDPKHQKALTNLGMTLAAEKRFDESFQAFSKAVGPAAAHSNVGVLMAKQGRNDDARKEFHEALALDSTLKQPKAFLEYLDQPR
jgi:Flp pilus assembly protein TadD